MSRLVITRETTTEILSGDATVTDAGADVGEAGSPVGVRLVPQWTPKLGMEVLPGAYRDIIEVPMGAVHPMRAHHVCSPLGLSTDKSKVEGFRSKPKRLVERGWLTEEAGAVHTVRPAGGGRRCAGADRSLLRARPRRCGVGLSSLSLTFIVCGRTWPRTC